MIFEYKQRLEKSLKAEKADHEKTKKEFEVKLSEQKIKHDKTLSEEESKLSSVQQHYKILEVSFPILLLQWLPHIDDIPNNRVIIVKVKL